MASDPPSRTRAASESRAIRVWGEIGVTICVNDERREFIRPSFGHERFAANSTPTALLKRAVRELEEFNEEVLAEMIRKMRRVVREVTEEGDEDDESPRARARRRAAGRKR